MSELKAMRQNREPEKVTMDKRGANNAAMDAINTDRDVQVIFARCLKSCGSDTR